MTAEPENFPLLELDGLSVNFPVRRRGKLCQLKAVQKVSLTLDTGETLGVVGESGCGKSTLGRTILRLQDSSEGTIRFDGHDITHLGGRDLRAQRRNMQMVFQDPYASFDPRMNILSILEEPLRTHHYPREEWNTRINTILQKVSVPESALKRYPHEFSGGQRQRIGIARALLTNPHLVVADEPVAALDVSIQAQILNLLHDLQEENGMGLIFIAHNLSTVQYISNRIAVMYLGLMVEIADNRALYAQPLHPYTQALISAIPIPDPEVKKKPRLLQGELPSPIDPPSGCPFRTRCPRAMPCCAEEVPVLREIRPGHFVACHRAEAPSGFDPTLFKE